MNVARTFAARTTLCAAVCVVLPGAVRAAEGLWTLDNLPRAELEQAWGFAPDPAWIAKVMHASLRVGGGCSGSFVSANGLAMTNHHCIEACVGHLATPSHDLLRLGFLASTEADERRCPGLALDRLDAITDVTARIARAGQGRTGGAFVEARHAEVSRIESACANDVSRTASTAIRCDVVSLYGGAVNHLYRYHRFDDVRLVFAPEVDIAQFGGDPDNFNFPRHDLDVALVRAYEDDKPVRSADFFRFAKADAEPGDLTITSGNPGLTARQATVAQLERLRDLDDPWQLARLAQQRGLVARFAAESAQHARVSREELDGIENDYKARSGELLALRDPDAFAIRRSAELALRSFAGRQEALQSAVGAWDAIAAAQKNWGEFAMRHRFTEGAQGMWTPYFTIARALVRAADARARSPAQRPADRADAAAGSTLQTVLSPAPPDPAFERLKLAWSLGQLREWLGADDPVARQLLGRDAPDAVAARWVAQTRLGDIAWRRRLWAGGKAAIDASDDPFIRVARLLEPESRALDKRYNDEVEAVERQNAERIAHVRFAQSGLRAYPDATFTLRLSFGVVEGWQEHGRRIAPFTTVRGLYERATDTPALRLPPTWRAAQPRLDPSSRMNFATSNDIVGGNSGSPVINRDAEIVGLVFDGNIHSLGGAFWWDPRRNRAVAVNGRFILETLDKVYRADRLVREIEASR